MVTFFPTPYPDELLYSLVARYHNRSGNECISYTLQELYNTKRLTAPVMYCKVNVIYYNFSLYSILKIEKIRAI